MAKLRKDQVVTTPPKRHKCRLQLLLHHKRNASVSWPGCTKESRGAESSRSISSTHVGKFLLA